MEIVVLLLVGLIAIVAFVRSGKVRQLLEESNAWHSREISFLRDEVANLRRQLSQLSERVSQQDPSAHPTQTATEPQAAKAAAIMTTVPTPIAADAPARIIPQGPPLPAQPSAAPPPIA